MKGAVEEDLPLTHVGKRKNEEMKNQERLPCFYIAENKNITTVSLQKSVVDLLRILEDRVTCESLLGACC